MARGSPCQLLQHRAGLRCDGALPSYHAAVAAGDRPWPLVEMLRRAEADRLAFPPRTGWAYSNIGYAFVRALIEREAGATLGPALDRLVFAPLGIAGVAVALTPADLDPTAWGNPRGYDPAWVYHGLILGPARAAALFLHRLLAGELLPPDLLAAMRDAHPVSGPIPGRPRGSAAYGLALMTGTGALPGLYVGHTGAGPGSSAAVFQRNAT